MSTPKHTPGPWALDDPNEMTSAVAETARHGIYGLFLSEEQCETNDRAFELDKANAQRIVDCVNACEGINPAAVPELIASIQNLNEQLDNFWNCGRAEGFVKFICKAQKRCETALKLAKEKP